jgi:hypothetical protein
MDWNISNIGISKAHLFDSVMVHQARAPVLGDVFALP